MKRFTYLFSAFFFALILVAYTHGARANDVGNSEQPVPMSEAAMAAASGGSEAAVQSYVYGNSIGSMGNSGAITGTDVANNSGLTTVIQNTGSQVSIATATIVNVNFH